MTHPGAVTRSRSASQPLFLRVPRVVCRIDVVDLPWANPMELDDGLSFRPGGVFHPSKPVTEGPGGEFFRAVAIERFSGREIKVTRNHCDPFRLWMGMWRNVIAVRKLETHYERVFLCWVAFEHGHFGASRYSRWSRFPFNGSRRIKTHLGGLRLFGG